MRDAKGVSYIYIVQIRYITFTPVPTTLSRVQRQNCYSALGLSPSLSIPRPEHVRQHNTDMTDRILPNGRFVPVVTKFKYLGSYISSDGSDTIDVQSRIDSAARAFGALSKCIFRSQNIDRKAKSAIYESLILSICLYGCESWCLTEKLYSKLRQFHARCVRTMSHITLAQSRMYQIPTREIETELGLDSMDKYIARRQLRWLGHVSCMPFDRRLP